jgi:RimJ/RimL family protein N-acetyltransferase
MRESLRGLDLQCFRNIPNFEGRLSKFLNELDEELEYWRGYEEKNGEIKIRDPIAEIACLDGENIIAISYYIVPKKWSLRWIYDRIFRSKGLEIGVVVKKDYHRRGIAEHLNYLRLDLLRELGYHQYWFRVDQDNIPSMRLSEKHIRQVNGKIWKKTDKQVYLVVDLD